MTMLTRWEPFREMRRLHDLLDRVVEEAWLSPTQYEEEREGLAPVDLYETDDEIVVKAIMPGMNANDINISVDRDVLTIRGERKETRETNGKEGRNYHLREIRFNRYFRSLRLPTMVDADKAKAEFVNGILTLTLPKAEEVKPKQISVKAK